MNNKIVISPEITTGFREYTLSLESNRLRLVDSILLNRLKNNQAREFHFPALIFISFLCNLFSVQPITLDGSIEVQARSDQGPSRYVHSFRYTPRE